LSAQELIAFESHPPVLNNLAVLSRLNEGDTTTLSGEITDPMKMILLLSTSTGATARHSQSITQQEQPRST
jgi:hypothetical protein